MSRYKYEAAMYRVCMYAELEYAKDEQDRPKMVKLNDKIKTKSGAAGIVVRMHDIRTDGDVIDQVVHFRDESIPDEAEQKKWIDSKTGEWHVVDDRFAYTMIDDIVEVSNG